MGQAFLPFCFILFRDAPVVHCSYFRAKPKQADKKGLGWKRLPFDVKPNIKAKQFSPLKKYLRTGNKDLKRTLFCFCSPKFGGRKRGAELSNHFNFARNRFELRSVIATKFKHFENSEAFCCSLTPKPATFTLSSFHSAFRLV